MFKKILKIFEIARSAHGTPKKVTIEQMYFVKVDDHHSGQRYGFYADEYQIVGNQIHIKTRATVGRNLISGILGPIISETEEEMILEEMLLSETEEQ